MKIDDIAVIILAAGQSTRFGEKKMIYQLGNGKTMLRACVEKYQTVFANVTTVLSDDSEIQQSVKGLGVSFVISKHSSQGMSQSLIAGVQSQPNAKAWMVVLGDMPYVTVETIMTLAVNATEDNIVVPMCCAQQGNPVIFGRDFSTNLMSLSGDVGAKHVIKDHSSSVLEVAVEDQGVLLDIDRPESISLINRCHLA